MKTINQTARACRGPTLVPALHTAPGVRPCTYTRSTVAARFQPSSTDLVTTPISTLKEVAENLDALVPPFSGSDYKGLHGRVGVMGGDSWFTGAPYFAAMAALTTGVDMSFVFCTPSAATAIKSYSPELIVVPALVDEAYSAADGDKLVAAFERARLTALVMGPGLGLETEAERKQFRMALEWARTKNLPIVLDGPVLRLLAKEPDLVKGYAKAILTPNLSELGDLAAGLGMQLEGPIGPQWQNAVPAMAKALQGPVILSKGHKDVASDGEMTLVCDCSASPRRAGGQGDVMAGVVAAYACWSECHAQYHPEMVMSIPNMMLAAYGGSCVTRKASVHAFGSHKHGMLAGDLIPCLPKAVYETELGA